MSPINTTLASSFVARLGGAAGRRHRRSCVDAQYLEARPGRAAVSCSRQSRVNLVAPPRYDYVVVALGVGGIWPARDERRVRGDADLDGAVASTVEPPISQTASDCRGSLHLLITVAPKRSEAVQNPRKLPDCCVPHDGICHLHFRISQHLEHIYRTCDSLLLKRGECLI